MLKLIFLRHNIKDGGYNSTNINKQLSPAQNTPAMQATLHRSRWLSFKLSGHLGPVPRKMVKFNPELRTYNSSLQNTVVSLLRKKEMIAQNVSLSNA